MSEIEISEAAEPRRIATKLIEEDYAFLRDATIRYLYTTQVKKAQGKVKLAWVEKPSLGVRYLASGENQTPDDGPDFVIWFSLPRWELLDQAQRRALVDHQLMHCGVTYDDAGDARYTRLPHDFEGFCAELVRHGLWHPDLERMGDVAGKQMAMRVG